MTKRNYFVRIVVFVLLYLPFITYPQHITDILVNTEPDSNAFKATSTSLHVLSPEKFIVIWNDDRCDHRMAWANILNENADILYDDFMVPGGDDISVYEDSYTVLGSYYNLTPVMETHEGYYQHFNNNQPISEPTSLYSEYVGMCGTGFTGEGLAMTRTSWGNVYVHNSGGAIYWATQNEMLGTTQSNWNIFYHPDSLSNNDRTTDAEHFSLFPSTDNSFAWCVISRSNYWWYGPRENQLLLCKIDQTGSTKKTKIVLNDTLSTDWGFSKWLHAETENDSSIVIFWAKKDSLIETHIDTSGQVKSYQAFLPFPEDNVNDPGYHELSTFHLSNKQNGTMFLYIGIINQLKKITIQNNHITNISESITDFENYGTLNLSDRFFQNSAGDLFFVAIKNNDPVLYKSSGSTFQPCNNLSFTGNGASQNTPGIFKKTNNSFAIRYTESDKYYKSVYMNMDGERDQPPLSWPVPGSLLFNNGEELLHLNIEYFSGPDYVTLHKFNALDGSLLLEKFLRPHLNTFTYGKLNDDQFFVFQTQQDYQNKISIFNTNGTLIDSLVFEKYKKEHDNLTVYRMPSGKFWLNDRNYALWDPINKTVRYTPKVKKYNTPLNDSLFLDLSIKKIQNEYTINLVLIDTSNIELMSNHISFQAEYGSYSYPILINDAYFILPYRINNQYMFNIFNLNLETECLHPQEIFPNASPYLTNFTRKRIGNHIVFACTDIRDTETGQNVYASIFNINDLITGIDDAPKSQQVPSRFSLSEPSPNPTKAGQSITFQLDIHKQSKMDFQLYNILGQRIQTFNRQFNEGQQSVRFQLPNLAAGVYFLKATDNQQAIIKKIAVIR